MELWTGIACLVADPGCKEFRRFGDDGKGAYVNIVAWAGISSLGLALRKSSEVAYKAS